MTSIAVVIPVGPEEHHARWLGECIASVAAQSRPPDRIVMVDDMHGGLLAQHLMDTGLPFPEAVTLWRPPWRLGVASAFNCGVALAHQAGCDLALMLGADDLLEPRVLERVVQRYETGGRLDGYYWCDVIYQSGEEQGVPCNNAAVTAGFMRYTGGLPIEASSGAMDAALISALLVHNPDLLMHVPGNFESRFWSRQHPDQETARMGAYGAANGIIRDVFTTTFAPPRWGRFD